MLKGANLAKNFKHSLKIGIFIIIAFILGGTGLSILFKSSGDLGSIIGGFALIGIGIAIVYNIIENE